MSFIKKYIDEAYSNNSYFECEEIYDEVSDWNDVLLISDAFLKGTMINSLYYCVNINKIIDEQAFIDDLLKINNLGIYPQSFLNFKYNTQISYLQIYCYDSNISKQIFKYLLSDERIFTFIQSPLYYFDNFENDRFGLKRIRFDPNNLEHQNENRLSKDGVWVEPSNWWRDVYSDHEEQNILEQFIDFEDDADDNEDDDEDNNLDEGCNITDFQPGQRYIKYENAYAIFSKTTLIGIYCKSFEEELSAPKILLDIIEKYNIKII
jgi:hypothetical protein